MCSHHVWCWVVLCLELWSECWKCIPSCLPLTGQEWVKPRTLLSVVVPSGAHRLQVQEDCATLKRTRYRQSFPNQVTHWVSVCLCGNDSHMQTSPYSLVAGHGSMLKQQWTPSLGSLIKICIFVKKWLVMWHYVF